MKLVQTPGVFVETYSPKKTGEGKVYAALHTDDDSSGSLLHLRFKVKVQGRETWLQVKQEKDGAIEVRAEWGGVLVRPVASNVVEIVAQ